VSRLLQAAAAAVPAGRPDEAAAALETALPEVDDAALLLDLQHQQARIAMWSSEAVPARERLISLADELTAASPQRAVRLLIDAALGSFAQRDSAAAASVVQRLESLRDAAERPEAVDLLQALSVLQQGDQAGGAALLQRCGPYLREVDPIAPDQLLLVGAACHLALDEPLEAGALLHRATAAARAASALGLLVFQLTWLSAAELTAGHWDAAYAQADEALRLAQDIGWRVHLPTCLSALAKVEALSGREQARAHAEQARANAGSSGAVVAYAASAVGLLELGRGRAAQSTPHFEEAVRSSRAGDQGVLVVAQFLPDLVEAHVRCGREQEARALASELAELAELTGRRSTRAAAARSQGLLSSGDDAEQAFAEALHWNSQVADPFDRARTELYLGEHLRRRKRRSAARAPLAAAERILSQLGAGPWAERARTELSLAGGGPPAERTTGLRELTAQELQVALAVADGQTNAEVARSLFLSVKTIEFHLGNAYRKLGLRSRSALARAVADRQLVPAGG
jgi:DNA-binding CsgD family transcriptional regulator